MSTLFTMALMLFVCLLTVAHLGNCQNNTTVSRPIVNIGVLISFEEAKDTKGYKYAVLLAKSLIDSSTKFKYLNDRYDLQLIIKPDFSLPERLIENAYTISTVNKPKPLAFIGPVASKNVDYTAMTLASYDPPIVTMATVLPEYNRGRYVVSSSPGTYQEVKAVSAFMKRFKWKRAGLIYTLRRNYISYYVDQLIDVFRETGHHLTGAVSMDVKNTLPQGKDGLSTKLKVLKQNDTKIFVAVLEPYEALNLFCEIYNLKMYGEDIVWLLSSSIEPIEIWLAYNNSRFGRVVKCSPEAIREAANGSFYFITQLIREDSITTDSGLTAQKFIEILLEKTKNVTKTVSRETLKYSTTAFDALWAVATALNNSIDVLKKSNKRLSIDGLSGSESSFVTNTIMGMLGKVDFQGIGGPYSYNMTNSPTKRGTVKVLQHQDMGTHLAKIGEYDSKQENLTFINTTKQLWGSTGVPRDHSTVVTDVKSVSRSLFIAIATLASLGIFLGILFLIFNLVYGKYKFIKLSAPLFNNIIACGCIVCLVSVFPFGMNDIQESKFPLVCKARAWTLTIGFSLAFGAMFVKTWRIYKICTNKKLRMKLGPLSNWYLLSLIGAIVLVDLIILITWELVDPMEYSQVPISDKKQDPKARFRYIVDVINLCTASNMVVWLTIIYVYKGILILYGLFLAYETRNVVYAHLNDSRVIGICVYNVVVLSIVGAFLSLLLKKESYQEMFIVLSICIIFPSVATICLMMFPKIAYRCKTNNLDDTETIANGVSTMRDVSTYNGTTMEGPQIHVTAAQVTKENTLQPTNSQDARFSYHKQVEGGSSEPSTNGENP